MRTLIAMSMLAFAAPALAQTAAPLTPAQAIAAATAAPSGKVEATVEFVAASTGASGFNVFLNSSANYRDADNLSAELHAGATNALKQKLGGYPEELLKGKRVRIKGVVRRVAIPKREGGSYFQTRIDVDTPDQIEILG